MQKNRHLNLEHKAMVVLLTVSKVRKEKVDNFKDLGQKSIIVIVFENIIKFHHYLRHHSVHQRTKTAIQVIVLTIEE